jgi:hypothetical protein
VLEGSTRETDFVALGKPGSEVFAGIETFPNPGLAGLLRAIAQSALTSDPVTIAVEAMRVGIGDIPAHPEPAVRDVRTVQIRWRRWNAHRWI